MLRYSVVLLLELAVLPAAPATAAEEGRLPLLIQDDFEKGAGRWKPTDPKAWRVIDTDRGKVYGQFQQSKYEPPHRSPLNIALLENTVVSDFVLTVKVQSTNKGAGAHRDMCLFFNYQDPAHFYYVHLGQRPDPHSSQIMIVCDAPREMITQNKSPGIPWDDGWHDVKIVRRVKDGTIEVYFDDMKKPVMTAVDKTFAWGQVGLGSFDDKGNWDEFRLHGVKVTSDKQKIQGNWKVVSAEVDGESVEEIPAVQIIFVGDRMTVLEDGEVTLNGKYTLDPAQTPAQIDLAVSRQGQAEVHKGIYKLEGGVLKICGVDPGHPRPAKLVTKQGDGAMLLRLRRLRLKAQR